MSEWVADDTPLENVWLTADECVAKHGIDPMRVPTGRIRNQLKARGIHLIRVWLEADVLAFREAVKR